MLLNTGGLVLILLITIYHIYFLVQRKSGLTGKSGMLLASLFALLAGLAAGIIGAQTFDLELGLSMLVCALLAAAAGAALGFPFGRQSVINSILSGVIGGTLGTVLGSLFFTSGRIVLSGVVLFILCSFLVQKMGDVWISKPRPKAKKANTVKKTAGKATYTSTILLTAATIIVVGGLLLQYDRIAVGSIGQPISQTAVFDEDNDMQVATIEVSEAGITPKTTEFIAAKMIKAIVNVKGSVGTGLTLVSKDLNFNTDLKEGQNIFVLSNPQPGTYEIEIPAKNYKGTFIVKAAEKTNSINNP
ncbi:cupredoxin domain-containing protein [Paenibacillus sp. NPDC056722]|uniref:cupredoxin domain-containing protein n=1 Tax=Paenibacillus sp. NPDC056722 TaxID=3345924 RepID=UPI0036C170E7